MVDSLDSKWKMVKACTLYQMGITDICKLALTYTVPPRGSLSVCHTAMDAGKAGYLALQLPLTPATQSCWFQITS